MNIIDIISKTKKSQQLSEQEIRWLVENFTNGNIPDYQMASWLMAVCLNGLTDKETVCLTLAMRDSGDILDLSKINRITVDKHSTGGVGDKTSLVIGPIAASCGVAVPKMSGRGLGHTGGTIDKLESIKGFRTELPFEKFAEIVNKTGFSIISQSGELCPADKKMYALRNATGTVDSIPLICASIMSKKLALNADCLLLDVKCGSGAFMKTREDAEHLARLMESVGTAAGKKCRAMVTDMDSPLGANVGNALQDREVLVLVVGVRAGGNVLGIGELLICSNLPERVLLMNVPHWLRTLSAPDGLWLCSRKLSNYRAATAECATIPVCSLKLNSPT